MAADTETILDIAKTIHEKSLLLARHATLDYHQVDAFENGFKSNTHLFQRAANFSEGLFHRIVEKDVHEVAQERWARISCEVVDCLSSDLFRMLHHRQRLHGFRIT